MADEQEETREFSQDVPFADSLKAVVGENYLGDATVIETIVRKAVVDLTDKFQHVDNEDGAEKVRVLKLLAQRNALILLGKSPLFVPVRRWNEPGGIDVFMAKWQGSSETDPDLRMEHAFLAMFDDILDIVDYANDPAVLPEQWQFQVDAVIHRFVGLCQGIDPPTQMLMDEPATVTT